ncbi:hypothetical protein JCM10296v2_007842 [Rhodotorula toruloides]
MFRGWFRASPNKAIESMQPGDYPRHFDDSDIACIIKSLGERLWPAPGPNEKAEIRKVLDWESLRKDVYSRAYGRMGFEGKQAIHAELKRLMEAVIKRKITCKNLAERLSALSELDHVVSTIEQFNVSAARRPRARASYAQSAPASGEHPAVKTKARSVQSPAVATPFLATPPPALPFSANVVGSRIAPLAPKESAVDKLDKLCIARLGCGYLPEYEVRQSPETGLFAASVRIPLQASHLVESPFGLRSPRPIAQQVVTFAVDFIYWSRTPAQEAVAELALTSDIVIQWASKTASATSAAPDAVKELQIGSQPVALPSVSIVEEATPAALANVDAQPIAGPPDLPGKKRDCPDSAEAAIPATNRGVPQEPVAKRPKLDVVADKQGGAGESVEILRLGCRDLLGPGAKLALRPTVFVCLDKNATDSRAFSLPALYASHDEACESVARVALQAGILDLLESRVRPTIKPPSSAKDRRESRGGKKQVVLQRTEEEQAAWRRASYGGFGAATAYQLAEMRVQAEKKSVAGEEEALEPRKEAPQEVPVEVEGNPLLPGLPKETKEEKFEGEAMKGLKAYFESRSFALPTIYREPSSVPGKTTDRVRIWFVHNGLRFELPAAHASQAEEKLASKVLNCLQEQEEATTRAAA